MNTPVIWKRPDLQFPQPFDTIFFDIDGVLIKTTASFRATATAIAEYIAGTINKLDWGQHEGKQLITLQDIEAFKQAGGYNDDWDLSYLLASLSTARLREWKGTPLAQRSSQQWAALSRVAHLQGHGGRAWVDATFPASARADYALVGELYHELYWGAAELKRRFGRTPRYLPDVEGLVHRETMLYAPDFPQRLHSLGIPHLGLITGRFGSEVDSALERIEAHSGTRWWEVVISADVCRKPDPRALRLAIEAVQTGGGLYIGDTADDYDLVRNYDAVKTDSEPVILAAVLVKENEVEMYKERGADIIIHRVEDLLLCLPEGVQKVF